MPLFGNHSKGDDQSRNPEGVKKMRTTNARARNRVNKVQQTKGIKKTDNTKKGGKS